jgi:LmbE family N-acetylglucosaminyl deacetylase
MWTAATINSLVEQEKQVDLIYVTSGDYHGPLTGLQRETEIVKAAKILGVTASALHLLRFSEKKLVNVADEAMAKLEETIHTVDADCVVTHDYEGGHTVHDIASFMTSESISAKDRSMWVFPSYHRQPTNRVWNEFVPGRATDYVLSLERTQQQLKKNVFEAHESQAVFFEKLRASGAYEKLFRREVLRVADEIRYDLPPTLPLGYDFTGSPVSFTDFERAMTIIRRR